MEHEHMEHSELDRMRHSASHVMAQAVLEMFPEAKYTIGPPIEDGFYYDFDRPEAFNPEDLARIEKKMKEVSDLQYQEKLAWLDHTFAVRAILTPEQIGVWKKGMGRP